MPVQRLMRPAPCFQPALSEVVTASQDVCLNPTLAPLDNNVICLIDGDIPVYEVDLERGLRTYKRDGVDVKALPSELILMRHSDKLFEWVSSYKTFISLLYTHETSCQKQAWPQILP
jgi:hypothetical protein